MTFFVEFGFDKITFTQHWHCHRFDLDCSVSVNTDVTGFIKISIHKPCTDKCGGLKIERSVTIEKHVDLALPIFEHIFLFVCKAHFLLEAGPIIPVYVSEQTFLIFVRKRCSYGVFLDTFCVVSLAAIGFVYVCTLISFYMGHMSLFQHVFQW